MTPVPRADSDAALVDRFLDDQATGDPYTDEFERPPRPAWRTFTQWLNEEALWP